MDSLLRKQMNKKKYKKILQFLFHNTTMLEYTLGYFSVLSSKQL